MVAELPPNENMVIEDREIPGPEDAPSVGVRIYRPKAASGVLPGIFFIHGGGMIMGSVERKPKSYRALRGNPGSGGFSGISAGS